MEQTNCFSAESALFDMIILQPVETQTLSFLN